MPEETVAPDAAAACGPLAAPVRALLPQLRPRLARLLAHDTSLWPAAGGTAGGWLGWLDGPERAAAHLARLDALIAELRGEGLGRVLLAGMGGSSLVPAVLAQAHPPSQARPVLTVLDSTVPTAVLRAEQPMDWARDLVVAASKSGTTVETRAHLARALQHLTTARGAAAAGRGAMCVTDPGSPLEVLAQARDFRAVVAGDPDVGGRYAALSPFGLLPAVLLGVDASALVAAAASVRDEALDATRPGSPLMLAAFLAAGVAAGRWVAHLLVAAEARPFAAWIEQLVAESTGKGGTGVLPVVTAEAGDVRPGPDRLVVALGEVTGLEDLIAAGVPVLVLPWDGAAGLGAAAMRWMLATALLGAELGIDPFDQPDVAAAKAATARALAAGEGPGPTVALAPLEAELRAGGASYLAVLAYVDPEGAEADALTARCRTLARDLPVPVTLGFGPRYLHSTGQLHKGGPPGGQHLVVLTDDPTDAPVPGEPYSLRGLLRAQAAGDLAALRAAGRRAAHVTLERLLRPTST